MKTKLATSSRASRVKPDDAGEGVEINGLKAKWISDLRPAERGEGAGEFTAERQRETKTFLRSSVPLTNIGRSRYQGRSTPRKLVPTGIAHHSPFQPLGATPGVTESSWEENLFDTSTVYGDYLIYTRHIGLTNDLRRCRQRSTFNLVVTCASRNERVTCDSFVTCSRGGIA